MYDYLLVGGMVLVAIGFAALIIYSFANAARPQAGKNVTTGFGGVVMIGPVPIIFGSSQGMVIVAEALAIVLILIAIIFFFLFSRK